MMRKLRHGRTLPDRVCGVQSSRRMKFFSSICNLGDRCAWGERRCHASSSDLVRDRKGARIRLVTAGKRRTRRGADRGVLDIQLAPGWKTYWRDPGDAGRAARRSTSTASTNIEKPRELDFPAPQRHDEGDF